MIHKYAELMGVTPEQIIEKNKKPEIAEIRFVYYKLRYDKHVRNYSKIAREVNRTPSTIMHGVKRINELLSIGDKEAHRKWNKVKDLRDV